MLSLWEIQDDHPNTEDFSVIFNNHLNKLNLNIMALTQFNIKVFL